MLGTAAVALAVLVQEGFHADALKAGLVFLVMVVANPVITFAAAKAKYLRETQLGERDEGAHPPRG